MARAGINKIIEEKIKDFKEYSVNIA